MKLLLPFLSALLLGSCCTCERAAARVAPEAPGDPHASASAEVASYDTRTIDRLAWSDREYPRSESMLARRPFLLGHVAATEDWGSFKAFTAKVDELFWIESEGERVSATHGTGGSSVRNDFYVWLQPRDWTPVPGKTYHVVARNASDTHRWLLPAEGLTITR